MTLPNGLVNTCTQNDKRWWWHVETEWTSTVVKILYIGSISVLFHRKDDSQESIIMKRRHYVSKQRCIFQVRWINLLLNRWFTRICLILLHTFWLLGVFYRQRFFCLANGSVETWLPLANTTSRLSPIFACFKMTTSKSFKHTCGCRTISVMLWHCLANAYHLLHISKGLSDVPITWSTCLN